MSISARPVSPVAAPDSVVGARVVVRGTLRGAENLVVAGRVEGTVELEGHLSVEAGGTVAAEVEAHEVTVAGAVEGDIRARDAVVIEANARVTGTIEASRVVLHEGAIFDGVLRMDVDLPADLGVDLPR